MNHIYRSLWSAALKTWIAVAETSKSKTKNHNPRRKLLVAGLLACSPWAWALPTGEQVVAGQATVNTPMPGQMQIHQTSPQAIINWQSFSIKSQEIVKIQQPTINSTLLNRVVGADASVIQGQLSANGQVFLINPNGVLFSPSAQVDVGGLVASTQSISNADFLKGNYHFTQNTSEGIVTNQGLIRVPAGGVVALIGTQVTNDGTISTPKGTTALAAGKTVDLDFQGDGLVEVKIPQAALDAQVANKGAILADGGRVVLTAQAANELLNTAVNQSGVIQARSLIERNGEIILAGGDNGTTQVSGTLNVNGQTSGGKINVSGKNVTIQAVANLTAQASDNGKAGTITVFGDMKNGTVNVAGKLDASAPKQGDGGFIETSAAQVNVANSVKVSTEAAQGKTGEWLIDPSDFTISDGTAYSNTLNTTGVTIQTTTSDNISLNSPITWSSNNTLTFIANHNININANITGSGTSSKLVLQYGQASSSGGTSDTYSLANGAKISLPAGPNFSTKKGSSGTVNDYTVITQLGVEADATTTTLQGMKNNLTGNYALGADIDASSTSGWNGGAGFSPVGDSIVGLTGNFDGLGHTITGLTINRLSTDYVGLFGAVNYGSIINNIGMLGENITGHNNVGGLAGYLNGGPDGGIYNSYATGNIHANDTVGGLVGVMFMTGNISNSYATSNVNGTANNIGGLVGESAAGIITASYATGSVTGVNNVGGLVGYNNAGTVSKSYATGRVTGNSSVGGLIGSNVGGTVTSSFWDTETTAQADSGSIAGATGKTTALMKTASTFSAWGTDISKTGGSSATWRIYEGLTYPVLRSFLTPLTVTANNISKNYNGLSDSVLSNPTYSVTPNANLLGLSSPYGTAKNIGTYTATGLYSNQQGYDISLVNGVLTINPAVITPVNLTGTRAYDGTNVVASSIFTLSGLVGSDDLTLTGAGNITSKNVGTYNTLTLGTLALGNGVVGLASNYTLTDGTKKVTITPATVTFTVQNATKEYDGTPQANTSATLTSGTVFPGDSTTYGSFAFTDKNAGTGKTVVATGLTVNDGNGGTNYAINTVNSTNSTINKANVTVTGNEVSKTYDGTTVATTTPVIVSGKLWGTDTLNGGIFTFTDKNVGTGKTVTASNVEINDGNGGTNYAVSYLANPSNAITAAPLKISTDDVTKTYDGTTAAQGKPVVVSGKLFENNSLSGGLFTFADKNAGINKTVTVKNVSLNDGNYGANYDVTYVDNTGSTITPAPITLSAQVAGKMYDGTLTAQGTATVSSGRLFSGDTFNDTSFYFMDKNAGVNKPIIINGLAINDGNGGKNYQITSQPATATITPANLKITANDVSKTYDGTTAAVGTAKVATGVLFAGDQLSGGQFAFLDKNAGSGKTVTVSGVKIDDGNAGKNYSVDYVNNINSLIKKANVTFTATDVTKTYDGTTQANSAAVVANGKLFGADSFSGGVFAFTDKNAGSGKTVTVSGVKIDDGNGGNNYFVNYSNNINSLINKANVTFTATDVTKIYDGTTQANSAAVVANGGLFGADSFSGGVFAFTNKNAGTAKTVSTTQVLVNDGNHGNNYAVNYQDNTHSTITPAALTLNANRDSKVYDGTTASTAAVTFTGLVGGDMLSGLRQSFASKNALGVHQSTLTVNSDYTLNDGNAGQNYKVMMNSTTGTITPANLTLTSNDVVKTYDGTTQANGSAVVANGILLGDDSLSGGRFAFLDKNAGAGKTVTVSDVAINDGNGGHNYAVNYSNNINSLINKANVTLTASDVTKIYDGTTRANSAAVVANGKLFGADSLSGGVFAFADKNAGAGKTVTIRDVAINDGNGGHNYSVNYLNNINSLIKPADIMLTSTDVSKIYDDTTRAKGTAVVANGGLFADDALSGGVFAFSNKNVSINKTVTVSDVQINDGNGGKNYVVRYADNTHSTIRRDESLDVTIASTVTNLLTIPSSKTTIAPNGTSGFGANVIETSLALNAPESASANSSDAAISASSVETSNAVAVDFTGGDTVTSSSVEHEASVNEPVIVKTSVNTNNLRTIDIRNEQSKLITPVLTVKNSAGRVKDVELSANRQYISLLLEDGSIRVWDLLRGVQRRIQASGKKYKTADIGQVDEKGDVLSIASQSGIHTYDVISSSTEGTIAEANVSSFANSNDATLLLSTVAGGNRLSLWDTKQFKKQWDKPYQRGVIKRLTLTDDKRYAAVLSQARGGVYAFTTNLQLHHLTDAVDILDMTTGKTLQSLPGFGEQVVSMQFNDNQTLQIGLANGQIVEWSLATKSAKTVAHFAKAITGIDRLEEKYAYVATDNSVQVADNQGNIELRVENKENPFQAAKLLENGKKLLTVMANGDLAIWDVASGKKIVRLFSTKQGWTVMDAFGRFDGSEEAMENFVWLVETEGLSLDNFSENYYEPGLLANLLKNEDYFDGDANAIDKGITLPPKVALQLANKQTTGDSVTLQLDVYDRGGGINNIKLYQNDRLISDEGVVTAEQKSTENGAEHRLLTLKITPTPGENTFNVVASNEMAIENSSPTLTFDGKSKAYNASLKVLSIGINRYKEEQLHLNYSVADASLMSDVLKKRAKIAVSKSLLDENATKAKILAELKELSQGSQQDSLVIYLAGHGVALKKEWYFLPYETQLLPTLKEIVANAISATELSDIFKNSKIQHILLMVDSCHSGGSMDVFSQLENGQRFFTRQLSRSLGITVITAAAKDQEAKELKSLGHGLFTYLMSEELQKNKPSEPVTAHGIAKTILKTLPAFSKMQIGAVQEPVSYMHGSDFILTGTAKK